jgi:MFS family permease
MDRSWRIAGRKRVLLVLCAVYAFVAVDAWLFSILLQPIKADLGLSDTELGFLSGSAVATFNVLFGIPMGRLADLWNRTRVIAIAIFIFGAMTALCSLAANFWQLVLMRVGGAIGEAGVIPPATSIIADMYPEKSRGTAMTLFTIGGFCGSLLAFAAGGLTVEKLGWRTALQLVALPGLLLVLIVLAVKEPHRISADGGLESNSHAKPHISQVMTFLWRQRSLRHLTLGASLVFLCSCGFVTWLPSYFERSYGMGIAESGFIIGGPLGVLTILGMMAAGVLGDRMGRRDERWRVWLIVVVLSISFPFCVMTFLAQSKLEAIAAYALPAAFNSFYVSPTFALVVSLALPRMRAMALAIVISVLTIVGRGMGPQFVGLGSEFLQPRFGMESLRYSLLVLTPTLLWAAAHFFLAGKHLMADLLRVRAET